MAQNTLTLVKKRFFMFGNQILSTVMLGNSMRKVN